MPHTYRVAVVGFAHSHVNGLVDAFSKVPNVTFVAGADTVPATPSLSTLPLTRRWSVQRAQEQLGIKIYEDYRELLEREEFDIAICCPENARHGEVIEAVAAKGAHVITEKPMSASYDDALRMRRATQAAGVQLVINWPTAWSADIRKVRQLVGEGIIGKVFELKHRGGSLGPRKELPINERASEWWYQKAQGGGSLLDYCCYGAMMSRWFFGQPAQAVTGMSGTFINTWGDADDNSALLVRFPDAMAIIESTWSTVDHGVPTGPIIYGSEGTIVGGQRDGERGFWLMRGKGEPERIVGEPLAEGHRGPGEHMVHCLETGEPLLEILRPEFNLDVQAILEAGIRSAATGKLVRMPLQ